jgi:hypothetical protein
MTRRLRPPVPLAVTCDLSGVPRSVRHAGHTLAVTHIAAAWTQAPRWWREDTNVPASETQHYRLVLANRLIFETHREADGWLLDRIVD